MHFLSDPDRFPVASILRCGRLSLQTGNKRNNRKSIYNRKCMSQKGKQRKLSTGWGAVTLGLSYQYVQLNGSRGCGHIAENLWGACVSLPHPSAVAATGPNELVRTFATEKPMFKTLFYILSRLLF
ncbi:hypothetical protein TNCT_261761 [Trichonephila clavata]|uniref:Uncharacterized protein n=1 Tax=Trichonephila clavata TaxID=2740835 RepID=A0A8X6HYD0_TRICU|nr:hypothetical protein TNCT_261761 [Trichonephila clavata]